MGCMSLLLELNAAEGIIAPAGIFALTIFLGNEKKARRKFCCFKNFAYLCKKYKDYYGKIKHATRPSLMAILAIANALEVPV